MCEEDIDQMEPYPWEWSGEVACEVQVQEVLSSRMLLFPLHYSLFHKIVFRREQEVFTLLPTIVFDHVGKLNNKFPFLIFLTALKGMFIFPPERSFAVFTVDVCNSV